MPTTSGCSPALALSIEIFLRHACQTVFSHRSSKKDVILKAPLLHSGTRDASCGA